MQGCCFLFRGLTNFSKWLRQVPWVLPLLCPRSGYCNATCPGMSQVGLPVTEAECADMCYKILLGLVTGEGKGDVGEAERQFHPTSPQGLCHLLATSLGSYLISLNFSFFFSDDKPAHQAVKLQHA